MSKLWWQIELNKNSRVIFFFHIVVWKQESSLYALKHESFNVPTKASIHAVVCIVGVVLAVKISIISTAHFTFLSYTSSQNTELSICAPCWLLSCSCLSEPFPHSISSMMLLWSCPISSPSANRRMILHTWSHNTQRPFPSTTRHTEWFAGPCYCTSVSNKSGILFVLLYSVPESAKPAKYLLDYEG